MRCDAAGHWGRARADRHVLAQAGAGAAVGRPLSPHVGGARRPGAPASRCGPPCCGVRRWTGRRSSPASSHRSTSRGRHSGGRSAARFPTPSSSFSTRPAEAWYRSAGVDHLPARRRPRVIAVPATSGGSGSATSSTTARRRSPRTSGTTPLSAPAFAPHRLLCLGGRRRLGAALRPSSASRSPTRRFRGPTPLRSSAPTTAWTPLNRHNGYTAHGVLTDTGAARRYRAWGTHRTGMSNPPVARLASRWLLRKRGGGEAHETALSSGSTNGVRFSEQARRREEGEALGWVWLTSSPVLDFGGSRPGRDGDAQTVWLHADPLRALGLDLGASPDDARRAYKRLALRHHPDVAPGDADAPRRFQDLTAAARTVHRDAEVTVDRPWVHGGSSGFVEPIPGDGCT